MADASFDAIIIGGGNKGLVLGMYLQKYGKMSTAIFEDRHEIGGGWSSEEVVPGFIGNTHATTVADWYQLVLDQDFPEFRERGAEWIPYVVAEGAIFKEDHSSFCIYSEHEDPTQEKTAKSLAAFSQKDAETWLRLWKVWKEKLQPAFLEWVYSPPKPFGEPDALEKALADPAVAQAIGFDPSWLTSTPLGVLRDVFESEAIIAGILRITHSWYGNPPDLAAAGLVQLLLPLGMVHYGCEKGGTHSYAHAAYKIFTDLGGKTFTKHEVDKVIVENGRATGIRMVDGTEVRANKVVISTLSPGDLVFRLTDPEMWSPRIQRRVANISRKHITITWYTWALHELPNYKASATNPDINKTGWLALVDKDPERLIRNHAWRALGKMPEELNLVIWAHTVVDSTQAPEGKHAIGTEDFVLPANMLTEKEWREFKKKHAEDVIRTMNEYAPNMTWDNVIGYYPLTPLDCCNTKNMAPEGNWAVIDHVPNQMGRSRPIPELASHRTPISGLYATGAAWHPSGGGFACQGYNCYKVIAEDLGLELPGKKAGRPF